jgi:hypothetical protein
MELRDMHSGRRFPKSNLLLEEPEVVESASEPPPPMTL